MELRPNTAREALLQVRLELSQPIIDSEMRTRIDRICQLGLDQPGLWNFELVDLVADRLAQAHHLLREIRELIKDDIVESNPLTERNPMLDVEIDTALALPPDLESMIERRPRELP